MNKTLILYYSYEGNTEKLANDLANTFDIKCAKLQPIKKFNKQGFAKYVWGGFQVISKRRPKLKPLNIDFDNFNNIIIASPIWAGQVTPAIYSFIKNNELNNKNISLFYTHKGGNKKVIDKFIKITQVNLNNIIDCPNVETDYENQKDRLLEWYKINFVN